MARPDLAPPQSSADDCVARLRELKEAKQVCSRRFGEARRAGQDTAPIKLEMQAITAELDAIESGLRDRGSRSEGAIQETAVVPALPPRFLHAVPVRDDAPLPTVRLATDADTSDFDRYVASHPAATPYHHTAWRRLIVEVMAHRDASFIARDAAGAVVGVLPLIHMSSRLFGKFAVSMPYFNYGGPLADSTAIEAALLRGAGAMAAERGLQHVEVRETRPRAGWPSRTNKVSMILRLPASGAALDASLGSKLRAQVQRARREGPTVHVGRAELLDEFYAVFAENMRDLGTPVYAKRFFAAVLAAWPDRSALVVVRHAGKPVGCAFLVGYRDMLEIPWASTLRRVNHLGVNMLMYREVLEYAITQGYAWFDFGRSTRDAGTYKFKKQWGAEPVEHYWHYWLPPGQELPGLNPDNPKYWLMIGVWKRLPVMLTRVIGPPVVRSIP